MRYNITLTVLNADAAYYACRVLDERFDATFTNFNTVGIKLPNVLLSTFNAYMDALCEEEVTFTHIQMETVE